MFEIDRRRLLQAGTLGLGLLALPGAAQLLAARGFTHDVASGEPGPNQVLLWTRYVSASPTQLEFQVSESQDFARIVSGGSVTADPEHDHIVKPVAAGLAPGRWYFYRFVDPDGRFSPVGRTRTLPEGSTDYFRLGVFSCANLPFGWFNAYGHAAARDDLDLIVHLGDYLYEYARGIYPSAAEALAGRVIEPAGEAVALADYRMRYAAYRADPDLQALHRAFPMVMMWDDHEIANDSWAGGAENHQPESEGDWGARKAAAIRACREWLPVSENPWESYQIGDLATLFRLETRLSRNAPPLDLGAAIAGRRDVDVALAAFRDGPWRDPARTLLGAEQERWLHDGFGQSAGAGTKWQLVAQQVIMGSMRMAPEVSDMLKPEASDQVRRLVAVGAAASRAGLPFNLDIWDGYPVARERVLRAALEADANLVVLSGDSHNAWAFDLDVDRHPAGVDFAVQSVTSPGVEHYLGWVAPADLARITVAANPQLKWTDTSRRGYLAVELTPEQVTGEWLLLDTVRSRSTAMASSHRMSVRRGRRQFDAT